MGAIRMKILKWLGVQSVVDDSRGMPESIANQMDAAQISAALANAEQGYVADLWNIYDSIIAGDICLQAMLNQRKLAVLNDVIQAEPEDRDRPDDQAAADEVNAAIKRLRRFRMGTLSHLMDGVLRPVSAAEMVFRVDTARPGKYMLDRIVNVPHFCEDFSKGHLELLKQDAGNRGQTGTETYAVETGRHIVHRGHVLTAPDNWGGPMRSVLFLWLICTCNREWWARSLERWGAPVPVGKYPSGDKAAKAALTLAFNRFHRLGGLVMSDASSVELIAGPAAGDGSAWEKLMNWAERKITIMILGQDLSSGSAPTGLGSGVADLHGRVRDDLTLMDETALAETLTTDMARAITGANAMPGRARIVVGSGTNLAKADALAGILTKLYTGGIETADESIGELSQLIGLSLQRSAAPRPAPGAYGMPMLSQAISAEINRIQRGGKRT